MNWNKYMYFICNIIMCILYINGLITYIFIIVMYRDLIYCGIHFFQFYCVVIDCYLICFSY